MSGTEYPKINSVFKRDERGRFLAEFACPEFEYLKASPWTWTEKVDGTNIRLHVDPTDPSFRGNEHAYIQGRTDNAQIPPKLFNTLVDTMRVTDFESVFTYPVVLYGEGYGAGIQKGGLYRPDPGFVLFDVRVGDWWLRRSDVEDVADDLGLDVVPLVLPGYTLQDAVDAFMDSHQSPTGLLESTWPGAIPEGVVGRPAVDLFNRKGERITTKLKFKDFRRR